MSTELGLLEITISFQIVSCCSNPEKTSMKYLKIVLEKNCLMYVRNNFLNTNYTLFMHIIFCYTRFGTEIGHDVLYYTNHADSPKSVKYIDCQVPKINNLKTN